MYRSEASRKKLRAQATDMKIYYESLEMVLEVRLTTRRYSDADIKALNESDDSDVIYVRLRDRFGDSGIVGVCILKCEGEKAIFDSLLLSCRVLGRRVVDAFVVQALRPAKKGGSKMAIGE